jgi:hypothetical protein
LARHSRCGPRLACGAVEPASIRDTDEAAVSHSSAQQLRRRALRLEYATLVWNVVGSVVVLAAAVPARSVGLPGSDSTR